MTSVVGLDNVMRLRPAAISGAWRRSLPRTSAAPIDDLPAPGGIADSVRRRKTAATEFGGLTDDQIANDRNTGNRVLDVGLILRGRGKPGSLEQPGVNDPIVLNLQIANHF